jgi:3D (Asp-Asp-Asp) domain-containing protein
MLVLMVVLPLSVGLACSINDIWGTPAPTAPPSTAPTVVPTVTPTLGGGTNTGGGTSTPTPAVKTPVVPCPEPKNWLADKFLITHYTIAMEDDDAYKNCYNCYVADYIPFWENGLTYHRHNLAFIYGILDSPESKDTDAYLGVFQLGTGFTHDGQYVQQDWNGHFTPDGKVTFTYSKGGKCAYLGFGLVKDQTIATSKYNLDNGIINCGDKYYIDIPGFEDTIFTVTDIGTGVDNQQFDIFVGPMLKKDFVANYPDTHTKHKVAKAPKQ